MLPFNMNKIEINPFENGEDVVIDNFNYIPKGKKYSSQINELKYKGGQVLTVEVNGVKGYIGLINGNRKIYFDKNGEIPENTYKKYSVPNNFGTVIVTV